MSRFLRIEPDYFLNTDFITSIFIKDLGDAFDNRYIIVLIASPERKEVTWQTFSVRDAAELSLANLVLEIEKLQE